MFRRKLMSLFAAVVLISTVTLYGNNEVATASTTSNYLMGRFYDNQNYVNLIWEHWYTQPCPKWPIHIGNLNLADAGIDNRIESATVTHDGLCARGDLFRDPNHGGPYLACFNCTTLSTLNNQISSYRLYR